MENVARQTALDGAKIADAMNERNLLEERKEMTAFSDYSCSAAEDHQEQVDCLRLVRSSWFRRARERLENFNNGSGTSGAAALEFQRTEITPESGPQKKYTGHNLHNLTLPVVVKPQN